MIVIIVSSAFLLQTLPTLGFRLDISGVSAGSGTSVSDSAETDDVSPSQPSEEVSAEPSYRRGRDYERWAYPNKTVTLVQYMGPRYVRHYATGQFVDIAFKDNYASGGYYLVQNAYIGLKIYDNQTVMYEPDMQYVTVNSEQVIVQIYDAQTLSWKDVDSTGSSLKVDAVNSTACLITRVVNSTAGRLEVTYVVKAGLFMKQNISFTSLQDTPSQFRVVQRLAGIIGGNVTYEKPEGSDERLTVNASKEVFTPYLAFEKEGIPILGVSLRDLGTKPQGLPWTSSTLKAIALDNSSRGISAEIVMGNFSLRSKESFAIDPYYTTSPYFSTSNSDVEIWYEAEYFYGDWSYYYHKNNYASMKFGCDYDIIEGVEWYIDHTYRSYMRLQMLLPIGATINDAELKLCSAAAYSYSFTPQIRTLDSEDCGEFTEGAQTIWDYWDGNTMEETTDWSITTGWSSGQWVSANVTANVQEFIDRSDYAPGNYMGLCISEGDATYANDHFRSVRAYDYDGAEHMPRLEITFTYAYDDTLVEPIDNWSFEDTSAWTISSGSRSVSDTVYMHGKHSWYVEGSSQSNVVIEQTLDSNDIDNLKNRRAGQNRGVCFSFRYKPDDVLPNGDKNQAYAQIIYNDGSEHTVSGGTVKPTNNTEWWYALVNASLPTNTQTVKVRIVGCYYDGTGFKANIDLALLSVYYYDANEGNCGDAMLTTNIYYSDALQHPEFDGFVSLGFGIAATAADGYSVAKLKDLTVELLPNDGSTTTQAGRLIILYLTQENTKNWTIRDLPTEDINIALDAGQLNAFILNVIYGEAITIGTFVLFPPAGLGVAAAKMFITGVAQAKTFFVVRRVALENPLAAGDTSYKVYETLDYSGHLDGSESDCISYASTQYYFDWRFRTDSDDVFAIKISGTVEWYQWNEYYLSWDYAGEADMSTVISIADYWQ